MRICYGLSDPSLADRFFRSFVTRSPNLANLLGSLCPVSRQFGQILQWVLMSKINILHIAFETESRYTHTGISAPKKVAKFEWQKRVKYNQPSLGQTDYNRVR